jgi:hypothetical protein
VQKHYPFQLFPQCDREGNPVFYDPLGAFKVNRRT